VLESLIKSGALDSFGRRASLIAAVDSAMDRAQKSQRDSAAGQHGLFGVFDDSPETGSGPEVLPSVADWDESTRLQNEKEVLGFFVSGHPLERYADKLKDLNCLDTATLAEMQPPPSSGRRGQPENEVSVAGILTGLRAQKSRKGDWYGQAVLEDMGGRIEVICFPEAYKKLAEQMKIEVPVLVRGVLRAEEGAAPKLSISAITVLDEIKIRIPEAVRIRVALGSASEAKLDALHQLILGAPGPGKLMLDFEQEGEYLVVLEPSGPGVLADRAFLDRAEELLGRGMVQALN
jgi:DNA polymerase III subunit alpha